MKLGLIDLGWPVGKHRHKKMRDIPTDYLLWVVYESDMPLNLIEKAGRELDRRGQNYDPFNFEVEEDDPVFGPDDW